MIAYSSACAVHGINAPTGLWPNLRSTVDGRSCMRKNFCQDLRIIASFRV